MRDETLHAATPRDSGAAAQSVVAPSLKVTGPVGTPTLGLFAETMAVITTGCPKTIVVGATARLTVATARVTLIVVAVDVLVANAVSPEYVAMSV